MKKMIEKQENTFLDIIASYSYFEDCYRKLSDLESYLINKQMPLNEKEKELLLKIQKEFEELERILKQKLDTLNKVSKDINNFLMRI